MTINLCSRILFFLLCHLINHHAKLSCDHLRGPDAHVGNHVAKVPNEKLS